MEYAKEGAKCLKCEGDKELYASQCQHLDPICMTCATKMAKGKTPCPTCQKPFTKVFRRYNLKPCPPGSTSKFIAKFLPKPTGSVEIVGIEKQPQSNTDNKYFRKSDKRSWIMYKEGAEGKRTNSKTASRPWILENVKEEGKYRGKQKLVDTNMYYMLQFGGKRIHDSLFAYPIKKWYEFESEIQYKTLTTDEAENLMKYRRKNEEGHARWIAKGKGKNDNIEDVDGQHENDETRKQKQINEEDNSDHDDEEKMSNPGEDWEHEKEFTDDDDLQAAPSASSEASESDVPSDMSDFENEKVSEFGKEIKNILKKERLGENNADEPVEKDENNDASNALDDKDKDCSDGKDQKKAKKEDDELKMTKEDAKDTSGKMKLWIKKDRFGRIVLK